jgi:hypothetical protein
LRSSEPAIVRSDQALGWFVQADALSLAGGNMRPFSFQREARWMLWLVIALPLLALLILGAVPALAR